MKNTFQKELKQKHFRLSFKASKIDVAAVAAFGHKLWIAAKTKPVGVAASSCSGLDGSVCSFFDMFKWSAMKPARALALDAPNPMHMFINTKYVITNLAYMFLNVFCTPVCSLLTLQLHTIPWCCPGTVGKSNTAEFGKRIPPNLDELQFFSN